MSKGKLKWAAIGLALGIIGGGIEQMVPWRNPV